MNKSVLVTSFVILCLAGCSTVTDTGAKCTAPSESDRIEANKQLARMVG